MLGLKTQESIKFNNFFELVQKQASKENKVFFLDCGEGRDIVTPQFEGEDLSGWLVSKDEAEIFENRWLNNQNLERWDNDISFAIWKQNENNIEIVFKKF